MDSSVTKTFRISGGGGWGHRYKAQSGQRAMSEESLDSGTALLEDRVEAPRSVNMRLPGKILRSFTPLSPGGCTGICKLVEREQQREGRVQTHRGTRDLLNDLRRVGPG